MVNTEEERKVQRCVRFKRKRLDWSDRRASKRRRHLQTKHGESRDTSFYKVKTHKTDLIRNSLKFGCKRSDAKDASSKRLGLKKREKICKEQSVLKSHEAIGTSDVPTDPFAHLCRLECQAVDIGVAAMETLLSNKQPIGRNSNNPTVVFSGRHKHAQWHPGGIWQAIVTEK